MAVKNKPTASAETAPREILGNEVKVTFMVPLTLRQQWKVAAALADTTLTALVLQAMAEFEMPEGGIEARESVGDTKISLAVSPAMRQQWKVIAAKANATVTALVLQAMAEFLAKRGQDK